MNYYLLRLLWGPALVALSIVANHVDSNSYMSAYLVAVPLAVVWFLWLPLSRLIWTTRSSKYAHPNDRATIRRFLTRQQAVFEAAGLTRERKTTDSVETVYPKIVKHSAEPNVGVVLVIERPPRVSKEDFEKARDDIASSLRLKFRVSVEVADTEQNHRSRLVIRTRATLNEPREYMARFDGGDFDV